MRAPPAEGGSAAPPLDASPVLDASGVPDAGIDAGDVRGAPALPSFGPGFVELVAPIEANIPFVAPPVSSFSGGSATVGVIHDIDGDGRPEVVLSAPTAYPDVATVLSYDTSSGSLSFARTLSPTAVLAIADLDDDGNVDVLSRQPFGVAWGKGSGAFEPVQSFGSSFSPRDVALDDVDRDGRLDVVTDVPDASSPRDFSVRLWAGPRTYVDRSDMLPVEPHPCPCAVLSGELHVGERLLMALATECGPGTGGTSGMYRETGLDALGYPVFEELDPAPGTPSLHIAPTAGITSRAAMGAALGDLDDDGFPELSITVDPLTTLLAGGPSFPLSDLTESSGIARVPASVPGKLEKPWGVAFVDLDQDGRKDVATAHGNDVSAWLDANASVGPQYATVHWNAGKTQFVDATDALGLGRLGQWKSLAVGDLDGDGDADLVVGGQSELPRVYRNDIARENHGFSLRLHGTSSNPLGIGALVDVTVTEGAPVQHHVAGGIGSPFAVSEPIVFVGLGAAPEAARVRITWPSGEVQELDRVQAGTMHVVEEPPSFDITPVTRHQPADGSSEAVVVVTPRDLSGNLRADATVSLSLLGTGSLASTTRRADGSFEAHVVAPVSKGSAAVVVSIDGVPLRVRPRLFWD